MIYRSSLRQIILSLLLLTAGYQSMAQSSDTSVQRLLKDLKGSIQLEARQYNGTQQTGRQLFDFRHGKTADGKWNMQWQVSPVSGQPGAFDINVGLKRIDGTAPATAVALSFQFAGWNPKNYVLVPAIVYNGNRYRSIGNSYCPDYPKDMYYNPDVPLTISNNPRLDLEKGRPSLIELQTTNTATPSMCFYAPVAKKGFIVLTEQQTKLGNSGLSISENATQDSCRFTISAPSMRKLAAGFGDFHPSGDKAPDWKAGDFVSLHCRVLVFNAGSIPELLQKFMAVRKDVTGPNHPRNLLPKSKQIELGTAITSNNFKDLPVGSYYLPENNNDFQLGWVSGMMNSYPMLALNNATERIRVSKELDFVVGKLQGKSGFFYGGITADGNIRPEKMHPDFPAVQAMVRKNSDALLWLMKHMMLFKEQGYASSIKPEWENATKKLAEAFVNTWKRDGQFGQYIVPETGEIAVFNSTAGAIAPAGLAMASAWFKQDEWLKVAKEAANYYYQRDVVKQGLTGGDCGDISQDANSESAFGFLESLMALYHYTGDKTWLQKAEVQAALCATWTISYDPIFPVKSDIGRLNSHMAGAVWASIQNKHAAPGICTASGDYLFKLYRATGNRRYADLINDIGHANAEAVNVPPHHITTNNLVGSSMERIQPSDAEGNGSRGNFINTRNSWTETNGVLMALELPGIYLQTDTKQLLVFDHVEASIKKQDATGITLTLKNPTDFNACVSMMVESSKQAQQTLSYTAFVHWPKVDVPAGATQIVHIDKNGKVKP